MRASNPQNELEIYEYQGHNTWKEVGRCVSGDLGMSTTIMALCPYWIDGPIQRRAKIEYKPRVSGFISKVSFTVGKAG